MKSEYKKSRQREYNHMIRTYCIYHHLCVDCKEPIDADGTSRRCSFCAKRHNLLAAERRKTWSPEKRQHVAMVQKKWRFNHPEYFKARRAQHEEDS